MSDAVVSGARAVAVAPELMPEVLRVDGTDRLHRVEVFPDTYVFFSAIIMLDNDEYLQAQIEHRQITKTPIQADIKEDYMSVRVKRMHNIKDWF